MSMDVCSDVKTVFNACYGRNKLKESQEMKLLMLRITSELWPHEVHSNVFNEEENKLLKISSVLWPQDVYQV